MAPTNINEKCRFHQTEQEKVTHSLCGCNILECGGCKNSVLCKMKHIINSEGRNTV